MDTLGLSSGNASIGNLSLLEAFMDNNENGRETHKNTHQRLHSYLGVKYHALEAKAELLQEFMKKVLPDDKLFTQEYN